MTRNRWTILPAAAFESHREQWDQVNRINGDHPLLDSTFVDCLLRHFGAASTRLAVSLDQEHPGLALVERTKFGVWETFQPSQAPLGLLTLTRSPAHQQVFELLKSLPDFPLTLSVLQQDPDFTAFPDAVGVPLVERIPYIETARLTLADSFETYWQSRGRNLVHNLSRQRRRLSERGRTLELVAERDYSTVAEHVRSYGLLESKGWKAAEGTAVTAENQQGRFYIDLLERFSRRGEAVIYRLLLDGRTVAVDLCLERNGTLIVLKTTYEEDIAGLSLGLLLHREMFKAVFEERRVKVIEFYGPVRDWHTKWTGEIRTMYHLTFHRSAWVGRARSLARAYARRAKRP